MRNSRAGLNTHVIGLADETPTHAAYTVYFRSWTKDSPPQLIEHGERTYASYAEAYAAGHHWNATGEKQIPKEK